MFGEYVFHNAMSSFSARNQFKNNEVRTDSSISRTRSNVLSGRVKPTAHNLCLANTINTNTQFSKDDKLTPCEPDRLIIGASKLLVRFTVLMSPCSRSLFEDEIAIWLFGCGEDDRTLLTSAPPGGGEAPRFDIPSSVLGGL